MKSTIITNIKWLRIFFNVLLVYYIVYNYYYGWNKEPIDQTEELLDLITVIGLYVCLGWIIGIILDFIKLAVQFIINHTKTNNEK